jgi:histidinol-phosphate aminotransferase
MNYFRQNIDDMKGYVPGEQLGRDYVKLNTNENPYPPSPKVIEAVRAAAEDLKLYPAPQADALRKKAAEAYGLSAESIMAGNGSDELLTIAVRAFVGEGERVVYPSPSYVLYPTLAEIQGAEPVEVPFPEDYSLPGTLLETEARLILLSNPNSPSGTFVPVDSVKELASRAAGIVLVDEAYVDFAEDNCLALVSEHDNVIVTRSFSKSFSLAGMRIGLAFARPEIINGMMKIKDSYNVGRLPIAAGVAALDDIAYMERNAAKIKAERKRLTSELEARKFEILPSSANFILTKPAGVSGVDLYRKLKERMILVRYFDTASVSDYVRMTIGTAEQMDALLAAIDEIVG